VGVFVFLRKRRRQKVEEDYRRSAAVRGFNQKPALDTRLDPVMVQRRDSVGSIADNQDYSRKILRVYSN
jgi:cell wall integrity and stress response component